MKRSKTSLRYGQWSMIGMLVAVAIILILAAMYVPRIAARHSAPGGAPTPRERAYGTACGEYESQMNQAVFMYKGDNDDHPPRSLEELKKYGVTDDMIHAEGCYFQIDPGSGHVSDLGHGQYVPVNPPASAIYAGRATGFHPDGPASQAGAPPSQPAPPAPSPSYSQPAYSQPPPAPAAAPSGGGTVGPGGIKIPNIPTAEPGI